MQVLAAYVARSRLAAARPSSGCATAAPTILDQMEATPAGCWAATSAGLLHAGDRRWGLPDRGEIAAQTPADLKALLAPPLANGPIEVVVVGDITVDKAIEAVAAHLRRPARPPRRRRRPAGRRRSLPGRRRPRRSC